MTLYNVKLFHNLLKCGYQTMVEATTVQQAYINARAKICSAKRIKNDEHLINVSCEISICEVSDYLLNNLFGGFK